MKVKVISLPYIFQDLYVLCFTRQRYQVSVYRIIGPLVSIQVQKIVGRIDFYGQFRKIKTRHKHIGYNLNVMRQSSCLVINLITVDTFAALLNLHSGGSGVRLYDGPNLKVFILVGWDRSFFRLLLDPPGLN